MFLMEDGGGDWWGAWEPFEGFQSIAEYKFVLLMPFLHVGKDPCKTLCC